MATSKSTTQHPDTDEVLVQSAAAPITDRVNVEPAILNGMTASEAQVIGLVSLVLCLMLGGLLLAVTGWWQALLLVGLFGPLLILWFASKYLAKIKRNRPDGYYSQAMHQWMARRGFATSKFIEHSGYWSLGRTLPFSLASDFEVKSRDGQTLPPSSSVGASTNSVPDTNSITDSRPPSDTDAHTLADRCSPVASTAQMPGKASNA